MLSLGPPASRTTRTLPLDPHGAAWPQESPSSSAESTGPPTGAGPVTCRGTHICPNTCICHPSWAARVLIRAWGTGESTDSPHHVPSLWLQPGWLEFCVIPPQHHFLQTQNSRQGGLPERQALLHPRLLQGWDTLPHLSTGPGLPGTAFPLMTLLDVAQLMALVRCLSAAYLINSPYPGSHNCCWQEPVEHYFCPFAVFSQATNLNDNSRKVSCIPCQITRSPEGKRASGYAAVL